MTEKPSPAIELIALLLEFYQRETDEKKKRDILEYIEFVKRTQTPR